MLRFILSIIVLYCLLMTIMLGIYIYIRKQSNKEHLALYTGNSSPNAVQYSTILTITDPIIRDKLFASEDTQPYNVSNLKPE